MPFPESVADLRDLCACMRELGVLQAFGVVLGPPPAKPVPIEQQTPEERRAARIAEARQLVRDSIAGRELTDAECDRYVDPSVFEAA